MCESAWPTWRITQSTSNRLVSSAIEMYVRRSVCGLVVGSAGSPLAARLVDVSVAASRTILLARWRVIRRPLAVGEQVGVGFGRLVGAAKSIDVRDDLFEEVRADLDLADPGLGLGVG